VVESIASAIFVPLANALSDILRGVIDRLKDGFIWLANVIWGAMVDFGKQVWGVVMAVASPIATAVQNAVTAGLTWLSQNIAGKIIEAYNYILQNIGGTINWFATVLFPGIGAGENRFARAMARSVGTYMGMKFFRRSLEKLGDTLIEGKGSILGAGIAFLIGAFMPYVIPQVLEGVLLSTYTYAKPQIPQPQIAPYQYTPIEAPEIAPPAPEYKRYVDVKAEEIVSVDTPASAILSSPLSPSVSVSIDATASVELPNAVLPKETVNIDVSATVMKSKNVYPEESATADVSASVELVT